MLGRNDGHGLVCCPGDIKGGYTMKYDLKWLKILHRQLQERFQYADSSEERREVIWSMVDVNEKISKILERDTD